VILPFLWYETGTYFFTSTLSFLTTIHSQRRAASPTVRVIDFQNLSAQSQRELINREISKLRTAVHANICNIIDIEASDVYTIRLNMEPITGMSLSDILQRSSPTKDQMSSLSAMVSSWFGFLYGKFILLTLDRQWFATSP
jgi:hypothetical protein